MSWKPEVQTDDSGKWYANGLAFCTKDEALASAKDLSMRWMMVREYRAVEISGWATHKWQDGRLVKMLPDVEDRHVITTKHYLT